MYCRFLRLSYCSVFPLPSVCSGASITEGPSAFAWLLDQIDVKSDLPLGHVNGQSLFTAICSSTRWLKWL